MQGRNSRAGADVSSSDQSGYSSSDTSSDEEEDAIVNGAKHARGARERAKKKRRSGPAEMTARKPVSRYRVVVAGADRKKKFRDPRFDPMCGKLNRGHWETAYSFIDDYKEKEISQMRKQLRSARNESEVQDLRTKLSQEIGSVEQRKRWKTRRNIKSKHRREQRNAVAQGKNPYYLKKSEIRKRELKTRFDELKQSGKLNKYVEKRRRKNAARDRRKLAGLQVQHHH